MFLAGRAFAAPAAAAFGASLGGLLEGCPNALLAFEAFGDCPLRGS